MIFVVTSPAICEAPFVFNEKLGHTDQTTGEQETQDSRCSLNTFNLNSRVLLIVRRVETGAVSFTHSKVYVLLIVSPK